MSFFSKSPIKINGCIDAENFNNEELFYQIIKRLIILINENLPSKITTSKEFEEILLLAEAIKKRLKSK